MEEVEALGCDCMCPEFKEAWLLSDSESEDQFGVPMRSSVMVEWEWDQREQAHSATPSSLPTPALDLAHHTTPPHRHSRPPRQRLTSRTTKRLAGRYAIGGCGHALCAPRAHAACTLHAHT